MIKQIFNSFEFALIKLFNRLDRPALENRILLGQLLSKQMQGTSHIEHLAEVEFKIFSQHREDGIIQYLINNVPISNKIFIEFGVGDYRESNTRFLLMNNNWKGLIIEGDEIMLPRIKSYDFYWKHDLTAINAFITKDNINDLFKSNGFSGDIGILSIDIDGNDYWIWDAITVINPRIVICEYNSAFGRDVAVTIPYDPNFSRTKAHYSNLYFGVSLKALCILAERKGYTFAGADSSGTNAFFIRKDLTNNIKQFTCDEGYVESLSRESRDKDGNMTYISGNNRIELIAEKHVYDVISQKQLVLNELIS